MSSRKKLTFFIKMALNFFLRTFRHQWRYLTCSLDHKLQSNTNTSRHLGWKNQDKPQKSHFNLKFSIFAKSFQMFPEGVGSVWECSLGLITHSTWYQTIFKAFFEKKSKVETCLGEAFCMSKTGFARENAFSSRKTRIF